MNLFKKILKWIFISFLSLLIIFLFVFVRFDISQEDLEDTYFTEYSHYIDIDVNTLEGDPLTISMHYQDLGDPTDPVVVLIHGAFSSSHTFLPWAESLVLEGYRVILPDLPYFGLSGGFSDQVTSFRRSAEAIKGILDALSITEFDIAGNSLGGAVSWFFTSEYPEMVNHLVLIDALYPYLEQEGRDRINSFTKYDIVANALSKLTPKFLVRVLLKTAYGDEDLMTNELLTRYYDLLRKEGTRKAILTAVQEAEPEFTYQERLESITSPTYVIWGSLDTWIDPSTIDLFQDAIGFPDNHIFIFEGLGHVPMEENSEMTVAQMISILNS
jgi:pimeloyl-ACP methyl ester carboxylesterase